LWLLVTAGIDTAEARRLNLEKKSDKIKRGRGIDEVGSDDKNKKPEDEEEVEEVALSRRPLIMDPEEEQVVKQEIQFAPMEEEDGVEAEVMEEDAEVGMGALRTELDALKNSALRKRAVAAKVAEEALEDADDDEDPTSRKETFIKLILEAEAGKGKSTNEEAVKEEIKTEGNVVPPMPPNARWSDAAAVKKEQDAVNNEEELQVGDAIEGHFGTDDEEFWFPGQVTKLWADGKVDVLYDDGEEETKKPRSRVRHPEEEGGPYVKAEEDGSDSEAEELQLHVLVQENGFFYLGVYKNDNGFQAIHKDEQLGNFATAVEAAEAYAEAVGTSFDNKNHNRFQAIFKDKYLGNFATGAAARLAYNKAAAAVRKPKAAPKPRAAATKKKRKIAESSDESEESMSEESGSEDGEDHDDEDDDNSEDYEPSGHGAASAPPPPKEETRKRARMPTQNAHYVDLVDSADGESDE